MALDLELVLIRPYGFDISEKAVRRAGLDYWKHVRLKEFDSFNEFLAFNHYNKLTLGQTSSVARSDLFFFSRFSKQNYFSAKFTSQSVLVFGAETKGLPRDIREEFSDRSYMLPTFSPYIRSLNLANTVTAVVYEAIRQTKFAHANSSVHI